MTVEIDNRQVGVERFGACIRSQTNTNRSFNHVGQHAETQRRYGLIFNMYTDQQYGHQGYGEEGWFGELIAAPLDHRYHEAVSHAGAALASLTAAAVDGGPSTLLGYQQLLMGVFCLY